jgi:hypothetical protein
MRPQPDLSASPRRWQLRLAPAVITLGGVSAEIELTISGGPADRHYRAVVTGLR